MIRFRIIALGLSLLVSTIFVSFISEDNQYELFLDSPSSYTFKCGCEVGEVLSSTLSGDKLTVKYRYPCGGEMRYGFLEGTYDRDDNRFKGIYNTENKRFYGEINFSFNDSGEALGSWGNGAGKLEMRLKSSIKRL